jgi:putative transposase
MIRDHELFLALGRDAAERRQAYRALFRAQLDDEAIAEIRKATNQGLVLGSERLRAEIERALGKRIGPRARGRPRGRGEGGFAGEQIGFEF